MGSDAGTTTRRGHPFWVATGLTALVLVAVIAWYVNGIDSSVEPASDLEADDVIDPESRSSASEAQGGGTTSPVLARSEQGLIALYDFSQGSGSIIHERLGTHPGLDLKIEDRSAVEWVDEGLSFHQPTLAATSVPPDSLYDSVATSNAFTVEAWIAPKNIEQNGPARILSLGADPNDGNFLLGQGAYQGSSSLIETRLRDRTGEYRLRTEEGSLSSGLSHIVVTRDDDATTRIYLNGELAASGEMQRPFESWDTEHHLGIGSELNGERPWLGTFHLLALYDSALDASVVSTNFQAGPEHGGQAGRSPSVPSREIVEPQQDSDRAERVEQHGIRWQFDDEQEVGRYANGDWWVVGPVTIERIDPPSQEHNGRVINGSMINPSPGDGNGYGHMRDVTYDAESNVAKDVQSDSPLRVAPGSSLVSTISVEEADARPGIETAAVLTIVHDRPVSNSFRPSYSGNDKTARFTTDQLRYELLPRLAPVAGAPDIDDMAANFERVWLDHRGGWTGRSIHPETSMPDYGRDLAARLGAGSLLLMLDFPEETKERLLTNYVQIGIDLYGVVENGGEENWAPNGGHAQGRKWPILFAGTMLGDEDMAAIGDRDDVLFGEDAQTFYVQDADIERGEAYDLSDVGMPEWGIRHATDSSRNDRSWTASYRQCCTANSWGGHVLSALLLDMRAEWNHDALFDYTDRYIDRQPAGDHTRFWDAFTETMWDTYRDRL